MKPSLDIKIGQMIMVGFRGTHVSENSPIVECIRDCHLGGVWLCDYRPPSGEALGNVSTEPQLCELVASLKQSARIPLLMAIDAEGGNVIRLKPEYGFPPTRTAAELGEAGDVEATRAQSRQIAESLRGLGFNLNFAPVVDVNINPENPALGQRGRCFSSDPGVVGELASVFVEEHRRVGIGCAVKHFPGQGSAASDTHVGFVDASEGWSRDELKPFATLIQRGLADAMLTGHMYIKQLDLKNPATLSPAVATELLRDELGFDGVLFSDDLGMGAIEGNYSFDEAIALAIEAGVDVMLHANTEVHHPDIGRRIFDSIGRHVRSGRLSEERIDVSYQRIMRLKNRLTADDSTTL
ncbi:MAG: glycosyl hydrolase [Phycisphaerae bacterium]|nr:MAG: glycosyl hydrolase [Phycisphaerae bacterium]